MMDGEVVEDGDFQLDGVTSSTGIKIEFLNPGGMEGTSDDGAMFPTVRPVDTLDAPGVGRIQVTLINAGNPPCRH